jgi:hypothetical protein
MELGAAVDPSRFVSRLSVDKEDSRETFVAVISVANPLDPDNAEIVGVGTAGEVIWCSVTPNLEANFRWETGEGVEGSA